MLVLSLQRRTVLVLVIDWLACMVALRCPVRLADHFLVSEAVILIFIGVSGRKFQPDQRVDRDRMIQSHHLSSTSTA